MPQFQRELGGRSPFGRVMNVTRRIDTILNDEIGLRRLLRPDERGTDVLSTLAGPEPHEDGFMTDREIRDELLTMLIAGHETTANALAWSFERLLRHPDVLDRLLAELDAGGNDYLDAVVKETLRQRPILPVTARRLTEEREVGEFTFPRGWTLMPCIYLIHQDPEVYPGAGPLPARAVPRRREAELACLDPVRRRLPPLRRLAPRADDDQVGDPDRPHPRGPRGRSGAGADRPKQHDARTRSRSDGHPARPPRDADPAPAAEPHRGR